MTTNRPLRVFLCHSSNDKPAVRELYQKLRAETWIEPWLDEEELYPGQDWNMEIEQAVEKADVILVCLSQSSITKEGYVQREIRIALDYADYKPEGTLFVIPIRLEICTPPKRLARWQYADYFEGQHERGLQRLLVSLKRRADSLGLKYEPVGQVLNPTEKIEEKKKSPKPKEKQTSHITSANDETPIQRAIGHIANLITENKITLSNGMEFMRVPAGKYITGNKEQKLIEIPYSYWMGKFLLTNEKYYEYVESKKIKHPVSNWAEKKDHPVVFVSWLDAVEYCFWLNSLFKKELPIDNMLRLPTKFEWEKAARGTDGRNYPWGNEFDKDKCNSWEGGRKGTTPVGKYSPMDESPYGCSDMWGNVGIWSQDVSNLRFPGTPYNVDVRITCGIAYNNAGNQPIYVNSYGSISENKSRIIGFRLVIAPPL